MCVHCAVCSVVCCDWCECVCVCVVVHRRVYECVVSMRLAYCVCCVYMCVSSLRVSCTGFPFCVVVCGIPHACAWCAPFLRAYVRA